MPLEKADGDSTALKRSGMVAGWLLLTFGMVIAAGIGFVGFLSHGSGPNPADSLMFNIPFYLGSIIYLWLAWKAVKRARRSPSTDANISSATGPVS